MVMSFPSPSTITLYLNQQADFRQFRNVPFGGFHQCLHAESKTQTVNVCRRIDGPGDRRVIFHFRTSTVSGRSSKPSGGVCSCSARNTTVTPECELFPSLSSATGVLFSSTLLKSIHRTNRPFADGIDHTQQLRGLQVVSLRFARVCPCTLYLYPFLTLHKQQSLGGSRYGRIQLLFTCINTISKIFGVNAGTRS